ncbi:src substrate protein p85-like [Antennarius striatus]|uniref:src substrate protein p85-like n=1 Tax=Antennarius striatus TaxID=241820 RepID=UPI0035B33D25
MWKSTVGHNVQMKVSADGDDWETDPDFENDVSEQEQRWGAKTVEGSGRKEYIDVTELINKVTVEHKQVTMKDYTPKASYGYGGKFGVEKDRVDKVALGHDYVAQVEQHSSQKDASKGFGGKFGVQRDRVDKSAVGFDYKEDMKQHASQKDYSKGFGGKYGVEKEKVDKVAVGYDYKGDTEKHQSQTDYSKGFGGTYGVEREKVDKVALGYDYKGETEKHQSQKDYSAGFGGRYGVQTDRMDKCAVGFSDMDSPSSAYEKTQPFETSSEGAGNLKARFENMAKAADEENRKKTEEEKVRRQVREKREREVAKLRQEEESRREKETPLPVPDVTPEHPTQPTEFHKHIEEIPEPEPEPEENSMYEEPPALPPRCDDFLELDDPQLPERQLNLDDEEVEGDYEELAELSPPSPADHDYEDVTCDQRAVAIYDFEGEADDEISFNPEDIITNIEMVDEGWWKGQCHGRIGLFPAAYVQLLK